MNKIAKEHPQLWYEDKDFGVEDDEGWINPSNIKNVLQGTNVVEGSQLEQIGVGIMTSDYAVQVDIITDSEHCYADGNPVAGNRWNDY